MLTSNRGVINQGATVSVEGIGGVLQAAAMGGSGDHGVWCVLRPTRAWGQVQHCIAIAHTVHRR